MATASKQAATGEFTNDALVNHTLPNNSVPNNSVPNNAVTNSALASPLPKDAPSSNAANGSVRVEIFDQVYNLRGSDAEYILRLAEYVDGKMRAVSQQTATVDSVRLAVLAALNIADEYHLLKRRLEEASPEARQRASKLASALDEVLRDTRRTG
ncbi:MAG: cell division protein ZapA [Terriglobales bacterium]|jgi:cell division protein ZapA